MVRGGISACKSWKWVLLAIAITRRGGFTIKTCAQRSQ